MSAFAVWVGSRNHSIQTVRAGPQLGTPVPQPPQPSPLLFFFSLLIMTSSDSGEQERGMGRGGLVRLWRPLLGDVFNYNFLKSLLCGFGALKFSPLTLLTPGPPLNRWTELEWGFPSVFPLLPSLQSLTLLLPSGVGTKPPASPPKPRQCPGLWGRRGWWRYWEHRTL